MILKCFIQEFRADKRIISRRPDNDLAAEMFRGLVIPFKNIGLASCEVFYGAVIFERVLYAFK